MTDSDERLEVVAEEPNQAAPILKQHWDGVPDRDETWRPVAPMDGCEFSGYEASDKGRGRSVDRVAYGRQYRGQDLSTRLDGDGYVLVDFRCDDRAACPKGGKHTFLMHKVVLTTFHKPCPPGMEARHSKRGPSFNWWPEGFEEGGWGTKPENHADMVAAGTAVIPEPTFPCRNAPTCTNLNRVRGRRCIACVKQVGADAAALLNAGTPLEQVAGRFGNGADWIYRLAVTYGGYEGPRTPAAVVHHGPCRCPECQPPRPNRLLRAVTFGHAGRAR